MENLPVKFQPEAGVMPAAFVFAIITLLREPGVPAIVINPAPPKITIPATPLLEKPVLPKFIVLGVLGIKFSVPMLVVVPAFVKFP